MRLDERVKSVYVYDIPLNIVQKKIENAFNSAKFCPLFDWTTFKKKQTDNQLCAVSVQVRDFNDKLIFFRERDSRIYINDVSYGVFSWDKRKMCKFYDVLFCVFDVFLFGP